MGVSAVSSGYLRGMPWALESKSRGDSEKEVATEGSLGGGSRMLRSRFDGSGSEWRHFSSLLYSL